MLGKQCWPWCARGNVHHIINLDVTTRNYSHNSEHVQQMDVCQSPAKAVFVDVWRMRQYAGQFPAWHLQPWNHSHLALPDGWLRDADPEQSRLKSGLAWPPDVVWPSCRHQWPVFHNVRTFSHWIWALWRKAHSSSQCWGYNRLIFVTGCMHCLLQTLHVCVLHTEQSFVLNTS